MDSSKVQLVPDSLGGGGTNLSEKCESVKLDYFPK